MPTIKQLSRIMSVDPALNRVQDQLASALNPILRDVKGDLTGPLESPTVKGLRGIPISQIRPLTGQSLVYNGTEWAPAAGGGGFITSVTAPLTVTSGVLSIPAADATTDGYLTSADWVAFDSKVSSVTATAPLYSTGGQTPNLYMTQVNSTTNGWLSCNDWIEFNQKISGGDPTVVLLVYGTGTTGSTTFLDKSYTLATLTANGNTQVAATPSKFGGGSASFDGAGDYISAPANAAYNFGTGDFTIEAWIYLNTMTSDYFIVSAAGAPNGLFFGFRGGTNIGFGQVAVQWDYDTPSGITTGGWYFVTLCRSGSSVRLFVDGVQVGTTQTITTSYNLGVNGLCIGSQGPAYFLNGYMNDVRVSNIARYTSNFTPPVFPFPNAAPTLAGGVLGYYGSKYPNPNGLSAVYVANINSNDHGVIPVRYLTGGIGNLGLATMIKMEDVSDYNAHSLFVKAGNGTSTPVGASPQGGGQIRLIGGNAYSGNGGSISLDGGAGVNARGGDIALTAGTASGTGNGGDVILDAGTSTSANQGVITLAYTSGKSVESGRASVPTKISGPTVFTPKATQTITAATDSFDPTRTYLPFDVSGGNYTLTSTPTILTANAVAGQTVVLLNVGTTNHIKLARGAAESLSLASPTQTIDPGGSMILLFDGTYWVEIGHVTATSI